MLNLGLIDTFRYLYPTDQRYTYWSYRSKTAKLNNIGWRIDYFLVTDNIIKNIKD